MCIRDSIGIIGVSAKRRNFGRTILENIIGSGFDKDRIVILRDGEPDPSGVLLSLIHISRSIRPSSNKRCPTAT